MNTCAWAVWCFRGLRAFRGFMGCCGDGVMGLGLGQRRMALKNTEGLAVQPVHLQRRMALRKHRRAD